MQEFNEILTQIESHGLALLISAIALFFAVRVLNSYVKKIETKKAEPAKSEHGDRPDEYVIQAHSILSTLDYILQIGVNRIFFANRFKQALFRDVLIVRHQEMKRHIVACLDKDWQEMSKKQLERYLLNCMTMMIIDTEEQIRKAIGPSFSTIPEGVDAVGTILNKFNAKFESHQNILFESIREFCSTSALGSNVQRVSAVLYALKALTLLLMLDAEWVLEELNGEFRGWTYKGILNKEASWEPAQEALALNK